MKKYDKTKELLNNKKNSRFYQSFDKYECGLVLDSDSIKKIINYRVSLNGSYGWIQKNELWLKGLIPGKSIKLLLNRYEIDRIIRTVKEKKYLMIPENLYLKNHKIKVKLMLVKRLNYTNKQKLETIKRKDDKKMKYF
ncbi:SsrA-binding protein [Candidatus Mycoplasma haematohominis]|uniref:SsrA-binding protein n=1 Tax=Candidatus Mycoplasma haematohominis TaxID=1494318 RepID=UPI001C0A74BD|nr:SsrA-binding protein [Candidatus Mycoplasma haemohominis]